LGEGRRKTPDNTEENIYGRSRYENAGVTRRKHGGGKTTFGVSRVTSGPLGVGKKYMTGHEGDIAYRGEGGRFHPRVKTTEGEPQILLQRSGRAATGHQEKRGRRWGLLKENGPGNTQEGQPWAGGCREIKIVKLWRNGKKASGRETTTRGRSVGSWIQRSLYDRSAPRP